MATFRLTLEYDGAGFEGWQEQPEGHRTVQGVLRIAARPLGGGSPLRLMGAGRTDAGVHAEGQVASLEIATRLDAATLQRALNARLPDDVGVVACVLAPDGFDARRDARGKRYRYAVWNAPWRSPLRARRHHHVPEPLDCGAVRRGAKDLVGTHDFTSFEGAGSSVASAVRTLRRLELVGEAGGELRFELEGDGFLRHMVRNLVGTLLEVGAGRRPSDSLPGLLAARDRTRAGATAPAHGLTLVEVLYDGPEGAWPDRDPGPEEPESAAIPGAWTPSG